MGAWHRIALAALSLVAGVAGCEQGDGSDESLGRAASGVGECRTIELVARREYQPPGSQDDVRPLDGPLTFALPQEIPVITGNAGPSGPSGYWARFDFRLGSGASTGCEYRPAPDGLKYVLHQCEHPVGATITADWFALYSPSGLASAGPTTVRLVITEPTDDEDVCTVDVCDPVTGVTHTPIVVDDNDPQTIEVCTPDGGVKTWTAPDLDQSVTTTVKDAYSFLYTGTDPLQTGVDPNDIDLRAAALVVGYVYKPDGSPKPLAGVSVLGHPEFGETITDHTGRYILVVNGGGPLTIDVEAEGFLPAQRQVNPGWQKTARADDIRLVEPSIFARTIDLDTQTDIEVVTGARTDDTRGPRQLKMMVHPNTTAELEFADGSPPQELSTLTLRLTEYTVGPEGPDRMPAALPPSSAYTYAVEIGVDEVAATADATGVTLDTPAHIYMENFIGIPVGTTIPVGRYDRTRGAWLAEEDGLVIAITGYLGGEALIDLDGNGTPESTAVLETEGFGPDTRAELAQNYPGATPMVPIELWHARLDHFSPVDLNFPYVPPADACSPLECTDPDFPEDDPEGCEAGGSVIECTNQVLGEELPIAGTPHTLAYRSSRVPGRMRPQRRVSLPFTAPVTQENPNPVPTSLLAITGYVDVAGRTFEHRLDCLPGSCPAGYDWDFTWDGLDVLGRKAQGAQHAVFRLEYEYRPIYSQPGSNVASGGGGGGGSTLSSPAYAFGRWGEAGLSIDGGAPIKLPGRWDFYLGGWDARGAGIGGFTFDSVHHLDVNDATLYLGNGKRRIVDKNDFVVRQKRPSTNVNQLVSRRDGTLLVSTGDGIYMLDREGVEHEVCPSSLCDGTVSTCCVTDMAEGPDGSIYFSYMYDHRVRRIDPDGQVHVFAGDGALAYDGDGGPAVDASIHQPKAVAAHPDGSVYIFEAGGHRLRRVDASGVISTVAGTGFGAPVWDVLASTATLGNVKDMQVGPGGSIYLLQQSSGDPHFVGRIDPDGFVRHVAGGTNHNNSAVEGIAAPDAFFAQNTHMIAVWPDATVDVLTTQSLPSIGGGTAVSVVRRVSADGIVTTLAGEPYLWTNLPPRIGGPAAKAWIQSLWAIAPSPDGRLIIARGDVQSGNYDLLKVERKFPGLEDDATQLIPSEDGSEVYVFDQLGRHLETRDALRNIVTLTVGRDSAGRITTLTDENGLVTTVHRYSQTAAWIEGPFGHETVLQISSAGYLDYVEDPRGYAHQMDYTAGGLMWRWANRNGNESTFHWDADGRLTLHENQMSGDTALVETSGDGSISVARTSPLGRTTTYARSEDDAGTITRTTTFPSLLTASRVQNSREEGIVTLPDGTVITTEQDGDPRFAMQAPIVSKQTTTLPPPSVLARVVERTRSATLGDLDDPLSLLTTVETTHINGRPWTLEYDVATRIETLTSPLNRTRVTTYDANGRVAEVAIPGVYSTYFTYDTQGRLKTTRHGPPGSGGRVTTRWYGSDGLLEKVTDPLLYDTMFGRNVRGDVTSETRPGNVQTIFGVDGEQQTNSITPPGKPAHGLTHGAFDKLASYDPPLLGGTAPTPTTYEYDLDKNINWVLQPGPRLVDYGYDTAGRLDTVAFPGGAIDRVYSPTTGRLTSIVGPYGVTLALEYEGPLVTSATWSGSINGEYVRTYDDDFRVATDAVGPADVTYVYDDDSLLIQAGPLVLDRDDYNGRVDSMTIGSLPETFGYSDYGELEWSNATYSGTPRLGFTYDLRDDLGRIVQKTETLLGGTPKVFVYDYDDLGRLETVTENGVLAESYGYDLNGNRTSSANSAGSFTATFDEQDRIETYGPLAFTWTDNGEAETKTNTSNGDLTEYSYDALGNLLAVTLPSGRVVDYEVDALGRRVGKWFNGSLRRQWLWQSQLQPVAEIDASGKLTRFVYASGSNSPDYLAKGAVIYRLLKDHLGSVRLVVNQNTGSIAQELRYDAWGRVLLDTNPGFQPFGFAGGLYDPDTKLVRFGARDYDPEIGRWLAKDPLRFDSGDTTNLFEYALSDPVGRIDATGEASEQPNSHDDPCMRCRDECRGRFLECFKKCPMGASKCQERCERQKQDCIFKCTTDKKCPVLPDPWPPLPGGQCAME